MKFLSGLTLSLLASTLMSREPAAQTNSVDLTRHSCIYAKDVIVAGASVSSGVGTSPLRILKDANLSSLGGSYNFIADPGSVSSPQLQKLKAAVTANTGTIFGIDLFFWDSTRQSCDVALKNIDEVISLSSKKEITLILGNIPALGITQPCRSQINTRLNNCKVSANCHLVDIVSIFDELVGRGFYQLGSERLTVPELFIDQLHLSYKGAVVYASELLNALDQKPPACEAI